MISPRAMGKDLRLYVHLLASARISLPLNDHPLHGAHSHRPRSWEAR